MVSVMGEDAVKQVIAEWVLTNGRLPGFEGRVKETLPAWTKVGPAGLVVYRAQGGFTSTGDASSLLAGYRPILATSTSPESVLRYAGGDCCFFEIHLAPGVLYLDVNARVTFSTDQGPALGIKNTVLGAICEMLPEDGTWPTRSSVPSELRTAILKRCLGRTIKDMDGHIAEYYPAENEIMVYGNGGTFSKPEEIASLYGKRTYRVTYSMAGGTRGRTFRRNTRGRNKNGYGPARQPKSRRNRNARDR
jgi:hypothetical protein